MKQTWRLFWMLACYHVRGQFSQTLNTALAIAGLALNNVVFFVGIYLLAFQGRGSEHLAYYGILATMILLTSGIVHTFFMNLRELGNYIELGKLDEVCAYPIHPLIYLALSGLCIAFLGDLVQGFAMLAIAGWYLGSLAVLKILLMALVSTIAFIGVYVLSGSLAFFAQRGGTLSALINEVTFTFSVFPVKEAIPGRFSILKYITPAVVTAILPMEAYERNFLLWWPLSLICALAILGLGVFIFEFGLKHYSPTSQIELKS